MVGLIQGSGLFDGSLQFWGEIS